VIITEVEETSERLGNLRTSIGSTLSGTGAAVRRRLDRNTEVPLALNHPILSRFVKPVIPYLRELLDAGRRVIIEGTQGFGLSVLHSPHYPFVTTRDTTAAAFISETGLSPFDVDDVVMVLRAMPIRVGGNSGPLPFEIDWHIVTTESESPIPLMEYTSVTKRVRRIARFDPEIVRAALISNKPTRIVLNHVDYIDDKCRQSGNVTDKARAVVDQIEHSISAAIDYVGISPAILIPSHATFAKALVG
jgi:adenylosuccinate synthase